MMMMIIWKTVVFIVFCIYLKNLVDLEGFPYIASTYTTTWNTHTHTHTSQISTMHRRGTSAGLHTPVDTGLTSVLCVCLCVSGWLAILRVGCHSTHLLLLPTTEEGRAGHVWHGLKAEREGGWRVTWGRACVCMCVRLSLPPGVAWSIKFTLRINDLQMIYKQVSVPSLSGCRSSGLERAWNVGTGSENLNVTFRKRRNN